jgi:uncharacterized phage protein (TIGR01671 family)
MREIKFRVWDKEAQQYCQPAFILGDDIWVALDSNKQFELDCIGAIYGDILIIEQFTGLHDNNGVEIYEGDRVRFYEKYDGKILYRIGGFFFEEKSGRHTPIQILSPIDCEVVGNIHEEV